jgi:putative spermidine/putrescine transport system substrate-binding protein
VAIPANAKQKAAAPVFIDWLTSGMMQTQFAVVFNIAPQNQPVNEIFVSA